jgi:hypothetical protein
MAKDRNRGASPLKSSSTTAGSGFLADVSSEHQSAGQATIRESTERESPEWARCSVRSHGVPRHSAELPANQMSATGSMPTRESSYRGGGPQYSGDRLSLYGAGLLLGLSMSRLFLPPPSGQTGKVHGAKAGKFLELCKGGMRLLFKRSKMGAQICCTPLEPEYSGLDRSRTTHRENMC